MSVKTVPSGGRAWLVAAACAVVVGAGIVALFRAPATQPGTASKPVTTKKEVGLAKLDAHSADALLAEEAKLRDPTPLFLPTRWNAGENALISTAHREPGGGFAGYAPKLVFAESDLKLTLPPAVGTPERPSRIFTASRAEAGPLGFGEVDRPLPALPERGGLVEVVAARDGSRQWTAPLPEAHPPGNALWQPMEFLLAINESGVVGPLIITESSSVAAVDRYFQSYLEKNLHLGERLAPGFYRVSVGP